MSTQVALPQDHPIQLAWKAYKKTEDYPNTRRWAAVEAHVDGSLWAAFLQGWTARETFAADPALQSGELTNTQGEEYAEHPIGDGSLVRKGDVARLSVGEILAAMNRPVLPAATSVPDWLLEILDKADPNWRDVLRPNLSGDEAIQFAVYDIAVDRRILAAEVMGRRGELSAAPQPSEATQDICSCPEHGSWINAADVNRMARELDVAMNGEAGAAKAPSLCDVVAQAKQHFSKAAQPVECGGEAPPILVAPAQPLEQRARELLVKAGKALYDLGDNKNPYEKTLPEIRETMEYMAGHVLSAIGIDDLLAKASRCDSQRARIMELRDALIEARDGLRWYHEEFPEVVDGSDDEAMARINSAIGEATTNG